MKSETSVRWCLGIFIVGVNLALGAAIGNQSGAFGWSRTQVPLLTGPKGGAYILLGRALKEAMDHDPESRLRLVPLPSEGSVRNLRLVEELTDAVALSFANVPDYLRRREEHRDIRAIAVVDFSVVQVVAAKASGVRQLEDLAATAPGQTPEPRYRVYVGMEGSGTREMSQELLNGAYVRWFDAWENSSRNVDFAEAARRMRAGELDVAIFDATTQAPAVRELLAARSDFQLLEVTGNVAARLQKRGKRSVQIPSDDGRTNVATVGSEMLLITHKNTQPFIVRNLAAALERHRSALAPYSTRTVSGAVPGVITDPDVLERMLPDVQLHEGLRAPWWEFMRTAAFQIPVFAAFLAVQLLLLVRQARAPKEGSPESSSKSAVSLGDITPGWATVIAAIVAAIGNLIKPWRP